MKAPRQRTAIVSSATLESIALVLSPVAPRLFALAPPQPTPYLEFSSDMALRSELNEGTGAAQRSGPFTCESDRSAAAVGSMTVPVGFACPRLG